MGRNAKKGMGRKNNIWEGKARAGMRGKERKGMGRKGKARQWTTWHGKARKFMER
jgi:hypothetical protein